MTKSTKIGRTRPHTRQLGDDEIRLWHRIAKTTKPLQGKTLPVLPKPKQAKAIIEKKPKAYHLELAPKVIKKQEPSIRHLEAASNHKRVRRGKMQIDDTLDLHGYNQIAAQQRLEGFIIKSYWENLRCVLVITGKGDISNKSGDIMKAPKGILRERLRDWLNSANIRPMIAGISQANLKHGGSGAFYILLKQRPAKV